MEKYEYLKKYINNEGIPPRNWFTKVEVGSIDTAEKKIGFKFPNSLRNFWLEIGYGCLCVSLNSRQTIDHTNTILSPTEIVDITLLKEESGLILPEAVEYIEEGYISETDIIFFEIADLSSFLVMKPMSKKPNAIYNMIGETVEESFEKFIWRLYHESPTFYIDNVEIEEKPTEEELLAGTPPRGELWEYINKNYHQMFRELGIYDDFWRGGEVAAKEMLVKFKTEIKLNYCDCGNLKITPEARHCLKCGVFSDPKV